jgi:hypothetical protein
VCRYLRIAPTNGVRGGALCGTAIAYSAAEQILSAFESAANDAAGVTTAGLATV